MKRIHTLLTSLGLSLITASAFAAQPLLSPKELQARLGSPQVRVIDIRDAKSFAAGHIAGSVNAPYGSWRGPANNPGELPALPALTALVQNLGLTPTTHAVVVSTGADATDFGATARVYWTLKVLGLKELSVLNGGLKAWGEAGLTQSTDATKIAVSNYQPKLDNSLIATKEELVQRLKTGDAALIDARPAAFFNGETKAPAAKVAGTLEGAVNLQHDKWFAPGSSTFVPADQAKKIAAASPIDPAKETVSFCNTGHWAATDWFGLSEMAGLPNVKLYAGSMVDWTQQKDAPRMANQPGRAESLAYDAKKWWEKTFK